MLTLTGTEVPAPAQAVTLDPSLIADVTSDVAPLVRVMRGSLYWGIVGERGGISVDAALDMAMRANPNLGTYEANRAAAQAELIRACQYPNPSVEFELGRARPRTAEEGGAQPSRTIYDFALSQPIEMPGKRLARQVEAQAGFAVVEGERREFLSTLRSDVIEAYYTVQYHAALERLHSALLEVANTLLEVAQTRVEVGEAGRIEVVNARVEVLRAERERNAAGRRRLAARAAFNALLGGCLDRNFRLSEGFPESPRTYSLQSSIQAALSCHPRLVRLAAELEQRYSSLDRARTEWWPDVNVGIRRSAEYDAAGTAATIGFEIPLWSRNQGGVARAQADAQKTYNDIVIAFTELRRDVDSAWQNLELAREQIASFDNGIRSASEEAITLAYEQYRLGAAGFSDVLIARRNLQESQQAYIQALYDAALAKARLERARGEICAPAHGSRSTSVRTESVVNSKAASPGKRTTGKRAN